MAAQTEATRPPAKRGGIAPGSILYVDGLTVSFDGFKALDGLSMVIDPGELRAVIGPNGAGKTTMMDVITGKTRADAGEVLFDGSIDVTRLDESSIAELGIGRKFQKPTVFEALSVFENLELALSSDRRVLPTLFFRLSEEGNARIESILGVIGLTDRREIEAGTLSHGEKQWLEIGMLLVQDQKLLLVDEPAAGMTDSEKERTAQLLRDISKQRSVVVVEHDMDFVRALDCRVTVLHEGRVIAEGSIDTVQADERVIEVYLGR